ncbi:MAG: ATP-binding cassette domain-containing protein [Kiritimatiellae bacterium]|nr:ATP-binding cassette domain-containing protein [Kiritimatiellia bacterium]
MALITLKNISVQFGGPLILDNVNLNIEAGERACVTGRNGEGKSTLLKILSGEVEPDYGEVIRSPGVRVAMLSQDVPSDMPGTVAEIVSQETRQLQESAHHPGADRFLSQLGVEGEDVFNSLSGGMRRRVLLARALSSEPHLLLLDEPTNHLDIDTIEWLEKFLQRSRCATLFVTHDRSFLQSVANKVLDLDRGQLAGWNCDYRTFLQRKQELLDDEAVLWERKGKKLAQEEAWLRKGIRARRTRNEGRVAALKVMREEYSARRTQSGVSKLSINTANHSGDQVIKIKNLSYAWPGQEPVIKGFTAKILRGERIGIIGANGTGKTTLINLLCGHLTPTSGEVRHGSKVRLAFLDQLRDELDLDRTIVQNIAEDRDEVVINGVRKHIFGYLEEFLFSSERAKTKVSALSGGEKARLLLAKLFTSPGNLLVMDEPTNDLDIETLELLEEQLMNYQGTLLLVSHDRSFIDNVVTSTFVLSGSGKVEQYPGGYADWLQQRPAVEAPEKVSAPTVKQVTRKVQNRLSYKEKQEREKLPQQIDKLEGEIARLQETIADPTIYQRDPALAEDSAKSLALAECKLETLFERWSEIEELAERVGE